MAGGVKPEGVGTPAPGAPPASMEIAIREADGAKVTFRVKSTTKLEKIVTVFCEKKRLEKTSHRFLFDGNQVDISKSVAECGLEDGDFIDCMVQQQGGMQYLRTKSAPYLS